MSSSPCAVDCRCKKHQKRSVEVRTRISQSLTGMKHVDRKGHVTSIETRAKIALAHQGVALVHGLSHHPNYQRWVNMMIRCHWTPTEHYGLRGIEVCEEWHDVATFVAYLDEILGPRPEGCSMDRIDNNGNYEPGNIRWATSSEQAKNRRRRMK